MISPFQVTAELVANVAASATAIAVVAKLLCQTDMSQLLAVAATSRSHVGFHLYKTAPVVL